MRIKVPKPQLEELGIGSLFRVASSSRANKFHIVAVYLDPRDGEGSEFARIICSCEGYQNSGNCWHTEDAQDIIAGREFSVSGQPRLRVLD